ncbi:MAG: hypothetical protein HQL46_04910 [Gammaproteobacteria bacterium]|nr:hypothetical protein [Gammaproteobacteria bacterium]
MLSSYKQLPLSILPVATKLASPSQKTKKIDFDDIALSVMTDLQQVSAITIAACDGIFDAEYKMKIRQVKLLFVVDHNEYIIGIVTYDELHGSYLQQIVDDTGIVASELCILDVMIGVDSIQTLNLFDINESTVGDIIMTLNTLQKQHILVLEEKENIKVIRGLFSTSQIGKQLEINITEIFSQASKPDKDNPVNDNPVYERFSA